MSRGKRVLLWTAIVFLLIMAVPASLFVTGHARFFYTPSDAMAPTFRKGDRFVAWMRAPDPLRRGDIVLVATPQNHIYVKRIAALPGDRIALVEGVVMLNGAPVRQREIGTERLDMQPAHTRAARRLAEQFPGEEAAHQIYDTGPSVGDDYPEIRVPPGHVFLLGDNRDDSADSRFPSDGMTFGLGGPVRIERIEGVPWFFRDWARFGQPAGH